MLDICANSVFPVKFHQKYDEIGLSVRKYHHLSLGEIQAILMGTATGVCRFESNTISNPKDIFSSHKCQISLI